jgi:hypothetical protein
MHRFLLAALLACLVAGCGREAQPQPVGLADLAAALRQAGVDYEVSEKAALPHVKAGGLRLTGKDLSVEVYRLEDADKLAKAAEAVAAAARIQEQAGARSPMRPCVRGQFLVIVRREPQDGLVESALARALPR